MNRKGSRKCENCETGFWGFNLGMGGFGGQRVVIVVGNEMTRRACLLVYFAHVIIS
jgi:hypothetical protein